MSAPIRIRWACPDLGAKEEHEVLETLRSGQLSMGPKVRRLEEELAARLQVAHVVATSSGTAALDVALQALGIGPGDEVIVPAFTYIATVNAVVYQGATPVLVDVDPQTLNLDPAAVRAALTARTRCIVPIDYAGALAPYDELERIAGEAGVVLLQDAAHSLGGSYHGRQPGAFGVGATLSFHIAKVVTTIEGGAVATNDDTLAATARSLRNQGEAPDAKYRFDLIGGNYRMSDLHAAIGVAQLARYAELRLARQHVVDRYDELLAGVPGVTPPRRTVDGEHGWFLYSVRFRDRATRDRAAAALADAGVETRICWPLPVYRQPAYAGRLPAAPCPHAEDAAATILSLPLHARLTAEDVSLVAATIRDAVGVG
jgi:perosamine synthetase